MKIIVRVDLVTDWGDTATVLVDQIERPSQNLEPDLVGLSLEDGKRILSSLQQTFVRAQTDEICKLRRVCQRWALSRCRLTNVFLARAKPVPQTGRICPAKA